MDISKRNAVRIVSFTVAVVGVLAVRNIQLMSSEKRALRSVSYTYSRAMGDLCDAVENVSDTLEKELYAGSGKMHQSLAVKLYREASSAKAALAQLPIEELQLESSVNSGEIALTQTGSQQSDPPTVTEGFSDFEGSFESYPSLIYDGPFSDNIMERTPRMTSEAENVSQTKALERCSLGLNMNSTVFTDISEVEGKMPCWRFSNEDKTVACEVTKQGGYISYFLKSRISESTELTNEQGVKAAEDFLDDLGILSMKTTYYENIDNVLTVNFAYNDLDVCCYTDLIKVSVAMDDGEILGFDAKGFLVNHYDRDIPEADISQSRAKESVSPRLEIVSGRLALIPTDGLEEKLCYEFRCRAENGRNVLVYINAQTAEEEQILILVESKSGTLTV